MNHSGFFFQVRSQSFWSRVMLSLYPPLCSLPRSASPTPIPPPTPTPLCSSQEGGGGVLPLVSRKQF